jgi:hypothetical protein
MSGGLPLQWQVFGDWEMLAHRFLERQELRGLQKHWLEQAVYLATEHAQLR